MILMVEHSNFVFVNVLYEVNYEVKIHLINLVHGKEDFFIKIIINVNIFKIIRYFYFFLFLNLRLNNFFLI